MNVVAQLAEDVVIFFWENRRLEQSSSVFISRTVCHWGSACLLDLPTQMDGRKEQSAGSIHSS